MWVVNLGAGSEPAYPTLADALRAQAGVAGVDGGYFHSDWPGHWVLGATPRTLTLAATPIGQLVHRRPIP